MRLKQRVLIGTIVLVTAVLVAVWFAPFFVGTGIELWIWWKAREEGLTVKIDKLEAPFLRPVVLRGITVKSAPDAAFRVELRAKQAAIHLNLKSVLFRTRARAVRDVALTGLRLELHRNAAGRPLPERTWTTWEKLLPNSGSINDFALRVEDGPAVILLRGGTLSFSDIEAGRVSIDEVTIASPFLRQTFSALHGATRWQDNRLTLAGLTLTRGLDAPSLTADLSHLRKQRVGVEFDLDAFGGKLRADLSSEWRGQHSNWTVAGSAADISLAQTAEAIGLADRVAGRLRACKFTFRGDPREPIRATASLWAELAAPAWRNREADVLMLGLALYNRQLDLQQLYIKQKKNQLTLSAVAPLPSAVADWRSLDFRGDISASIPNLGEFAALFGAVPEQFGGEISINGTITSHGAAVGGELSAAGKSLIVFGSPADLFSA